MSEEEQIERMKRNQERLANRKKPSLSSPLSQRLSQGSETREEVCQIINAQNWVTTLYKKTFIWIFSAPLPSKGDTSCNSGAAVISRGQKGFCWRPSSRAHKPSTWADPGWCPAATKWAEQKDIQQATKTSVTGKSWSNPAFCGDAPRSACYEGKQTAEHPGGQTVLARGQKSRAYRDLQDPGSCGQGTYKLRL